MNSSRALRTFPLVVTLAVVVASMAYGDSRPDPIDVYETQVFRFEVQDRNTTGLARGDAFFPLGSIAFSRRAYGALEAAMSANPEAAAELREYRRLERSGVVMMITGTSVISVGFAVMRADLTGDTEDLSGWWGLGAVAVGAIPYVVGVIRLGRAPRYLYSAVNTYNRRVLEETYGR